MSWTYETHRNVDILLKKINSLSDIIVDNNENLTKRINNLEKTIQEFQKRQELNQETIQELHKKITKLQNTLNKMVKIIK